MKESVVRRTLSQTPACVVLIRSRRKSSRFASKNSLGCAADCALSRPAGSAASVLRNERRNMFPSYNWRLAHVPSMTDSLSRAEISALRRLRTPEKIQRFLDCGLGYNKEKDGETCRSPRRVLRDGI